MGTTVKLIDNPPDLSQPLPDPEVWLNFSQELQELAKTIVNPKLRLAWMLVISWLNKHEQALMAGSKKPKGNSSFHY